MQKSNFKKRSNSDFCHQQNDVNALDAYWNSQNI